MSQWLCRTRRREASEAGGRNSGRAFLLSVCAIVCFFVLASMNSEHLFLSLIPGRPLWHRFSLSSLRSRSLSANSNTV